MLSTSATTNTHQNYPGVPYLTKSRRKFSPKARSVAARREVFEEDIDDDIDDLDLKTSLVSKYLLTYLFLHSLLTQD